MSAASAFHLRADPIYFFQLISTVYKRYMAVYWLLQQGGESHHEHKGQPHATAGLSVQAGYSLSHGQSGRRFY